MSMSTSLNTSSLSSGMRIDTPILETARQHSLSGVRRSNSFGECRSATTTPRRTHAPGRNSAFIGARAAQALEESFGDIADQRVRLMMGNLEASLTQRFLNLEIRLTRTQSMICDGIGPEDSLPDMSIAEQIELLRRSLDEVRLRAESAEDRCARLEEHICPDVARQGQRLEEMIALVRAQTPSENAYTEAVKELNAKFMKESVGNQMLAKMLEVQEMVASIREEVPSHEILLKMQEEHAAAIRSEMASREALAKMGEDSVDRTFVVELQEEIASVVRAQVRDGDEIAKLHQDVHELCKMLKSHILEAHRCEDPVKVKDVSYQGDAVEGQEYHETTEGVNTVFSLLSSTTDMTNMSRPPVFKGEMAAFKEELAAAFSTHVMELERAAAKARAQILEDQVKATLTLKECLETLPDPTAATAAASERGVVEARVAAEAFDHSVVVDSAVQLLRLLGGCARDCVCVTLTALLGPPPPVRTAPRNSAEPVSNSIAIELAHPSTPPAASPQ